MRSWRRLHEADWLLRRHGDTVDELAPPGGPDLAPDVGRVLAVRA